MSLLNPESGIDHQATVRGSGRRHWLRHLAVEQVAIALPNQIKDRAGV